ncbi:MAG: DNA-directed polymerase subunit [Candidatus Woesearchaeota archaeon]|nr:DNA-directed polymerase subunit [Candidatus Woesearchaeota archaeon]
MQQKKACRKCRMIVTGDVCPNCGGSSFSSIILGRVAIIDPAKSEIAKRLEFNTKGEYALRVR